MGIKREQLWITSKLWNDQHRPEQVEPACRKTLKDLGIDYLDLYLIHWPSQFNAPDKIETEGFFDNKTSIVDTWKAMEKLVDLGLTKHVGVSNFTINMLERLKHSDAKLIPYTNQCEFHLYHQQGPLRKYCHEEGIIFTGYSTLGTADSATSDFPVLLKDEELGKVASETGKTVGEVELKFLLTIEPGASLLAKSITPERIYKNNHLDFELTKDQVERLRRRERAFRYCDPRRFWKGDIYGDGY